MASNPAPHFHNLPPNTAYTGHVPVREGRQRAHDDERPLDVIGIEVAEKRDALHCFPKTHLVSKNPIKPCAPKTGSPRSREMKNKNECLERHAREPFCAILSVLPTFGKLQIPCQLTVPYTFSPVAKRV